MIQALTEDNVQFWLQVNHATKQKQKQRDKRRQCKVRKRQEEEPRNNRTIYLL